MLTWLYRKFVSISTLDFIKRFSNLPLQPISATSIMLCFEFSMFQICLKLKFWNEYSVEYHGLSVFFSHIVIEYKVSSNESKCILTESFSNKEQWLKTNIYKRSRVDRVKRKLKSNYIPQTFISIKCRNKEFLIEFLKKVKN